jgi:hypothetical protein
MTRFKELARIEAAIQQWNEPDLKWALGYSKMRLSISASKEHINHWKQVGKKVIRALEDSK